MKKSDVHLLWAGINLVIGVIEVVLLHSPTPLNIYLAVIFLILYGIRRQDNE